MSTKLGAHHCLTIFTNTAQKTLKYLFLASLFFFILVNWNTNFELVKTITFLIILIITADVLGHIFEDAKNELSKLDPLEKRKLIRTSVVLFTPVLILSIISIGTIQLRNQYIEKQIYLVKSEKNYSCLQNGYLVCQKQGHNIRANINSTITYSSDKFSDDFHSKAKSIKSTANNDVKTASDEIKLYLFESNSPLFPNDIRHIFKVPTCDKFYHWITRTEKCVRMIIFEPINNTYEEQRGLLYNEINVLLADAQNDVDMTGDRLVDEASIIVNLQSKSWEQKAIHFNSGIFTWIFVLSLFFWMGLFFISIKSYCSIFARLLFSNELGGQSFSLDQYNENELISAKNITKETNNQIGFREDIGEHVWYLFSGKSMSPNKHGLPCIPKPSQIFLRKIANKKLGAMKYTATDDGKEFGVNSPLNISFVRIDLLKTEKIYFKVKNLVAVTQDIKMKTQVHLKLAAFLQFKFLFPTISGPGSVILCVEGGSWSILPEEEEIGSSPFDLVAFDIRGEFHLQSKTGFRGMYFGGYSIFPHSKSMTIRQSPQGAGTKQMRLIKKLWFFFMPF